MTRRETYLDWNATAPVRPEAVAAVAAALRQGGNPSSVHRAGRAARQRIERGREAVAALAGADPDGVIFVSGGTEANHLALLGSGRDHILVSAVEHGSVLQAVPEAGHIPVDRDGIVGPAALDAMLRADPRPALVSVMLANNETGIIQPVARIAEIAHGHGALFHCDAVQAAGKIPLDAAVLGADIISLSAHKIGGPPGIGALVITGDAEPRPLLRGGGQERGRRAGTENLPGIAGLGAALDAACARRDQEEPRLARLRDRLERGLLQAFPGARANGAGAPRLPSTSSITFPGVDAEALLMALDLEGICASAGSACHSGSSTPSSVLTAMGLTAAEARGTLRLSLGWSSVDLDVDRALEAIPRLARQVAAALS